MNPDLESVLFQDNPWLTDKKKLAPWLSENPEPILRELLENWVYTELAKSFGHSVPIHYRRSTSGAEVDFVVVSGERILAVEVKASSVRHPRLPRSTRSFIEAYKPTRTLMVNLFLDHVEVLDKTEVKWLPPWELSNEITKIKAEASLNHGTSTSISAL